MSRSRAPRVRKTYAPHERVERSRYVMRVSALRVCYGAFLPRAQQRANERHTIYACRRLFSLFSMMPFMVDCDSQDDLLRLRRPPSIFAAAMPPRRRHV